MTPSDELRASLGLLFGDLPDAVRLIPREGDPEPCNETARSMPSEGLGHLCPPSGKRPDASCPACQHPAVFDRGKYMRWHVTTGVPPARDYYEVTLCPVRDRDGGVWAILEILRDATATLGVEQYLIGRVEQQDDAIRSHASEIDELEHSQAQRLNRDRLTALTLLVAGVSHEVHTPLGALMSSADLLRRTIDRLEREYAPPTGDPRHEAFHSRLGAMRESTQLLDEGARRIQSVVSNLRQFTRLDEADRSHADLNAGLNTTVDLLRYRFGSRIRVLKSYADELPLVFCRPNALNQVFLNLLLNAEQAIDGPGEIQVSTYRDGDDHVRIEIADNGPGISDNVLRRIFDLGFTTRAEGSGIGLSLSRRIIEEHAGTIHARSREDGGARFVIRLPVNGPPSSENPTSTEGAA